MQTRASALLRVLKNLSPHSGSTTTEMVAGSMIIVHLSAFRRVAEAQLLFQFQPFSMSATRGKPRSFTKAMVLQNRIPSHPF